MHVTISPKHLIGEPLAAEQVMFEGKSVMLETME
jgi:hypothetical protein